MKVFRSIIFPVVVVLLTLGWLWYARLPASTAIPSFEDIQREAIRDGYRLINTDELQKLYMSPHKEILLVDTRQEWEFRAGHIKGAVNFPMEPTWWARWRKKEALGQVLGTDKQRSVIFY